MRLNTSSKNKILDFYRDSNSRHTANGAASVGWSSEYGQLIRFEVLDKAGDLDGASILDVGCGVGGFYNYLIRRHKDFHYLGIDIVPEFITRAKNQFPEANFKNMELADVEAKFNYVICSGALNAKIPDYKNIYFSVMQKMFSLAKIAAAFNFLDIRHHDNDRNYAAFHPEQVLQFCRSFARRAVLVSGYLKWDASIFLYH